MNLLALSKWCLSCNEDECQHRIIATLSGWWRTCIHSFPSSQHDLRGKFLLLNIFSAKVATNYNVTQVVSVTTRRDATYAFFYI